MAEFDSSVTAYFGGDTSGLKNAVGDAGNTLDKLSNKVADKVLGMRDMSTAIATALGLNIEKIAEKVARFVTGMSKETEESFKELTKLSQETADINIAAGFKRLNAEQQVQMLENQRNALQEKFSRTQAEVLERQKQMREAADASNISLFEASRLMEKSKMTAEESRDLAKMANELAKNGVALQEARNTLDKKNADQRKADEAAAAKAAEEQTKSAAETNAIYEKLYARRETATTAYQKMLFEQKSTEEQLLNLGKQKEELEREMRSLEKDSTRYMEDAVRLAALEKEIKERKAKVTKTEEIPAEKELTEEVKRRLRVMQVMQTISRVGENYDAQSTTQLEGVAAKLTQQLNTVVGPSGGLLRNAQGTAFTSDPNEFGATLLLQELQAVERELALRREVIAYDQRYGDMATIQRYGDNVTSRALQGFTSTQERTNTVLNVISRQLAASGLFPGSTLGN